MLIFNYLAKEVFLSLASLLAILLLIFMSDQCVVYLQVAANGKIPFELIRKLLMFEVPLFAAHLLPFGFYIGLLLTYSRLYTNNEITALHAYGYGPQRLLKHSVAMAFIVALITMLLTLWLNPICAKERAKLVRTKGLKTMIETLGPGRFHSYYNDRQILYVASTNREHTHAKQVFWAHQVQRKKQKEWDILWADEGYTSKNTKTDASYIVLKGGKEYEGTPGHADYQITEFESYKKRLLLPSFNINGDVGTFRTRDLLPFNKDLNKMAEFQWRLSIPLMVFTLTLLGVPLSQVDPRSGKYTKLLLAIVIYITYSNGLFVAHSWLNVGKTPPWLGMWWIHLLIILLALLIFWRNYMKLS